MRYKLFINDYDALGDLYNSTSESVNDCETIKQAREKAIELLNDYGRSRIIGGTTKIEIQYLNGKTKEFINKKNNIEGDKSIRRKR